MSIPAESIERLLVASLIGLLIGLDRERAEIRKAHPLFAGIRTFPLIALSGAVPVLLLDRVGPLLLVASLVAVAGITVAAYIRTSSAGDIGATTEFAALVTFLLGALAGAGESLLAGGAGIAVAVLLVAKPRLERLSRALTEEELASVLELAVISCIVLPLLPNRGYGPWQVLNPFDIWLVVVLVSAASFGGFVMMRVLGSERGMVLAGAVGALVSSTAVTVAMANRSREEPELGRLAASSAVLASTVMCARVAAFAAVAGPGILPRVAPVLLAMAIVGLLAARVLPQGREDVKAASTRLGNPFSLRAATAFAFLYAVVLLVVGAARASYGSAGTLLAAALSSLIDVDAVTIALARGGPGPGGWRDPAAAVAVAVVVNTLVKLGMAVVLGSGPFRRHVAAALGVMAGAGLVAGVAVYFAVAP